MNVDDFDILDDAAAILLNGSGIFALSSGDGVDAVTHNLTAALTQTDYKYVDAFPKEGGARVIAVKFYGQRDVGLGLVSNLWTSNF